MSLGVVSKQIEHAAYTAQSENMQYISTRGQVTPVRFSDAVMTGLAADGGLLVPEQIPDVRAKLADWSSLSYHELAFEILQMYTDLPDEDLKGLISRSYAVFRHPEVTPTVKVDGLYILELFHGPTLAFKDVALQFLGNVFEYLLDKSGSNVNILTATSGDTGSAAIHGALGRRGIRVFVLYPRGRVSPVQELQMTSVLDDNIHNLAIDGDFDDCQSIVKTLFGDPNLKRSYRLGAMNSINWARVLAQIVYYFYAALQVMRRDESASVSFSVPSGNFGNIFAGFVAWQMGLPIRQLILATNENDILARFFNMGDYTADAVRPTLSPSMDIQVASNFERYLYYRVGGDTDRLRGLMGHFANTGSIRAAALPVDALRDPFQAGTADTDATLRTIQYIRNEFDYLLDPHSAVGVYVGMHQVLTEVPLVCLATAHPSKFGDAIKQATGDDLARHELIDQLAGRPTRNTELPADADAVRSYVCDHALDAD